MHGLKLKEETMNYSAPPPPPPEPPNPGKSFLNSIGYGAGGCLGIVLAVVLLLIVAAIIHAFAT
jgi:hypothetical protein